METNRNSNAELLAEAEAIRIKIPILGKQDYYF